MLLARQKIFRLVGVVNRRFYCLYNESQHDEQTFVSFYKKLFGKSLLDGDFKFDKKINFNL